MHFLWCITGLLAIGCLYVVVLPVCMTCMTMWIFKGSFPIEYSECVLRLWQIPFTCVFVLMLYRAVKKVFCEGEKNEESNI